MRIGRTEFDALIEKGRSLQQIEHGGVHRRRFVTFFAVVSAARNKMRLIVIIGKQRVEQIVPFGKILPFYKRIA